MAISCSPQKGYLIAALFAHLAIRIQTITGARLGEIQQIAQNPDCIKQLINVGPKAAARWLLRMVPKGSTERQNYFIDERTKDDLMEVISFLREHTQAKKIPVVAPEYNKTLPDRYVFQWGGRMLNQCTLNSGIRFLLHGAVVRTSDGQGIHLTSHILRHAFATEMAGMKVSVDVIAAMLHQRDTSVTKYYSQPTRTQVMDAAEMVFVDRIDVAAEALRSPAEIGRMLDEAEGKVGALTEVIGGTCVVANLCPAKFACIGCAGNAPDPEKRYQIEQKMAWAREHALWSTREKLFPEERRLNQLVQDCELMLEEMSLIEQAQEDSLQNVQIEIQRIRRSMIKGNRKRVSPVWLATAWEERRKETASCVEAAIGKLREANRPVTLSSIRNEVLFSSVGPYRRTQSSGTKARMNCTSLTGVHQGRRRSRAI